MDNRSRKFLWLLIIIDYQYQSIIDGNRSINITDCYQYAISIDYLFSQTFPLSISSSTYKVSHFDIIKVKVSCFDSHENHFCTALSLFAVLVTFDAHYNSWEWESLLRCFVTICCACHLWCPPGKTFCYSVNPSWEFHTKDRGGRGRLHRHIKKEEKKEITISLIVFEWQLRPRSVESL